MTTSDVVLYSINAPPVFHPQLNGGQCLKVLMPHLDSFHRSSRSLRCVAELNFEGGVAFRFSSDQGAITVSEQRPLFGQSRKLMGFIPVPAISKEIGECTDFTIHQIVARAYGNTAPAA